MAAATKYKVRGSRSRATYGSRKRRRVAAGGRRSIY